MAAFRMNNTHHQPNIGGINNSFAGTADPCGAIWLEVSAATATDTSALRRYFECLNKTDFLNVFIDFNQSLNTVKNKELPLLIVIISAFVLMSIFGSMGNGLVVYTVCANRHMRTARNVFITNLAISDLILCVFTQPLNVVRWMHNYLSWELGTILCKVVNMFTGVNMFVSTLSITAIALDRFQAIVYPTRTSMNTLTATVALVCIWQVAAAMSSPLLLFANIASNKLYANEKNICSEITTEIYMKHAKAAYSLATLIAQYLVPLVIVSVAYFRIYLRMQHRMIRSKGRNTGVLTEHQKTRQAEEKRKQRRANILLISISVIFALSWLPITLVNIIQDFRVLKVKEEMSGNMKKLKFDNSTLRHESTFFVTASQSIPLLLVLMSACINPVLYAWLNDNFRTEFRKIFCSLKSKKREEARKSVNRRQAQDKEEEEELGKAVAVPFILCSEASENNGHVKHDNASSTADQKEDFDIQIDVHIAQEDVPSDNTDD